MKGEQSQCEPRAAVFRVEAAKCVVLLVWVEGEACRGIEVWVRLKQFVYTHYEVFGREAGKLH